ncbi:TPA: type II restriction endonuclease subunit M [Pseudomonas putida]|nr:type II restriction endonuclease subunit M [Pseudomonas sp. CFA]HEN8704797.1 type II restriction endonuclease subunit M [Pseudomonas putida]
MTTFLRLLTESDKASALVEICTRVREATEDVRCFEMLPESFSKISGSPFAYWISESVQSVYEFPSFDDEDAGRGTRCGLGTLDDFRFLRLFWEPQQEGEKTSWKTYFHGGKFSRFYDCFSLVVNWTGAGAEVKSFVEAKVGSASRKVQGEDKYFQPGFVFPRRTKGFCPKFMPRGGIFSTGGQAGFAREDQLAGTIALLSSQVCTFLISLSQGRTGDAAQYEVGLVKRLPWPADSSNDQRLSKLALRGWSLARTLDTTVETSPAFLLPAALQETLWGFSAAEVVAELENLQEEINEIAFELYGFSGLDRAAVMGSAGAEAAIDESEDQEEFDEDEEFYDEPSNDALLSWAVGVVFGRFDLRLATGGRAVPPEPGPFEPLPVKSPGMLPDGVTSFHQHAGILVDDPGHSHDLARLVERVLESVDISVAQDVRRWVQKDFFALHLKRYSKSRRKAPIYWPLATASGSYTLWVYYPSLSDQTLFTAVNDFVDPKLDDVRRELQALRDKGTGRDKQEEKRLEALVSLEHELANLRDSLLEIAPNYRPSRDDGVQITSSPLWKLLRLKPWQKVLRDTWAKLEKGDYDWAHLAMNYWPQRVRERCVTDKSLAISHGLEHLYVEPELTLKKTRGRKKAGSTE